MDLGAAATSGPQATLLEVGGPEYEWSQFCGQRRVGRPSAIRKSRWQARHVGAAEVSNPMKPISQGPGKPSALIYLF